MVVPEEFIHAPVKVACAGTRNYVDLPASGAAGLGVVYASDDTKLADRVNARE